ncbi:hypothetical protein [Haloarchaeobius sp. HME9146]|uniref:hypothetical protein n=1 Tax=Haloarchaeobius sp. HME9146 TaxID=2978732 RepID=UPI0021C161A1|nr:hypothetical protein [Haloarchaeobius sp. HME9146]MCT9097917.1 hypothetical protein [Haloarchaeobius sp. HME9146]
MSQRDAPQSCTFCERTFSDDDDGPDLHSLCHRRVDLSTEADAVTERLACEHCFDEISELTDDMAAHDVDATDPDSLGEVDDCSLCGDDFGDDDSLELLAVDDICYLLCADCTGVFDQFVANVPETTPEATADMEAAVPAGHGDDVDPIEVADEPDESGADSDDAGDDTADDEAEAEGDDGPVALHDANQAAEAVAAADASDLKNVLDSGLDDVEEGYEIRFDVRRDSRDGSSEISTMDGVVTRAETSYIGGSTIYVHGDDGEEYRLESSFSSEAVRVSTVDGHDLDFRGHLDALVRLE